MTEEKKEFGKAPELYSREIDWRRALDKTYGVDFKANVNVKYFSQCFGKVISQ